MFSPLSQRALTGPKTHARETNSVTVTERWSSNLVADNAQRPVPNKAMQGIVDADQRGVARHHVVDRQVVLRAVEIILGCDIMVR